MQACSKHVGGVLEQESKAWVLQLHLGCPPGPMLWKLVLSFWCHWKVGEHAGDAACVSATSLLQLKQDQKWLLEERIYFSLRFQREKVHQGQEGIRGWNKKLADHVSIYTLGEIDRQTEDRKWNESIKPTPVILPPTRLNFLKFHNLLKQHHQLWMTSPNTWAYGGIFLLHTSTRPNGRKLGHRWTALDGVWEQCTPSCLSLSAQQEMISFPCPHTS